MLPLLLIGLVVVGPDSGPPKGAAVPKLKVHLVQDTLGEAQDVTAKRKDWPTAYVFILKEKWERPTARFLRELDTQMEKVDKGRVVVVWIAENAPEDGADYLKKVQAALMLSRTMWTVFHGDAGELGDWEINPDTAATATLARDGKVLKSVGYRAVTDADVKPLIQALKYPAARTAQPRLAAGFATHHR